MRKYVSIAALVAIVLFVGGCNDADRFDYGKEVLVMTGTEESEVVQFVVEDTPSTYQLTVSATGKVTSPITVDLAIDNSLVDTYNEKNRSSYYALPESALELSNSTVTIDTGSASSSIANLKVLSTEEFIDGRIYLIPVTIKHVEGSLSVLETSRTIYLRVARVIEFTALDISNYNMYSNFIFDDALAVDLSNYTYEVKCYIDEWHAGSEPISRLCQWTSKDESRSNMLRFGENGQDINSLQWVNPAGNLVSATRFQTKTWYTLSFTYDGSTLAMYVDGVRDVEGTGSGNTTFQRFELGMSWGGGYPQKQRFLGRIAEVRVWNRALSTSEIRLGLCGVDVASDGLVAYWKMNEGSGHIFHDATGNGYDMDWSDTQRDNTEGGTLNSFDYSSYVESGWIFDANNKCSN